MQSNKAKFCAMFVALSATAMTGCIGESILSAGAKVASGQIASLTANEIKILNQTAVDIISSQDPSFTGVTLTDAQAEAVADFFQANELNTFDDFEALVQLAQTDPSQIEGLDALAAAFAGTTTEIDPNNVNPDTLDDIFDALFGGSSGYDAG